MYYPVGIPPSLVYIEAMPPKPAADLEKFKFRHLHPQVKIGTASDRYAGWLGQIYTEERYQGRIEQRTKVLGEHSFTEEVLPVDSVAEYFTHFPVLEIDFTFYRTLKDQNGKPTQTFQVLKACQQHLRDGDALLLKVPQVVTAPRLRRGNQYRDNLVYLDTEVFIRQFYWPAVEILGPALAGFIFEKEYLTKQDRPPVTEMAAPWISSSRLFPGITIITWNYALTCTCGNQSSRCWNCMVWGRSCPIGPGCRQ